MQGQPPPYGQGQPQYGQPAPQSYQYGQPGQQQFPQQGKPSDPMKVDFAVEKARVPGVLMILSSLVNLAFVITVYTMHDYHAVWNDIIAAVVLYMVTGVLAVFASRQQQSKGPAIALIILSSMTMFTCLTQMSYTSLRLVLFNAAFDRPYQLAYSIAYMQVVLMLLAVMCFFVCIALIVVASVVACDCCGRPPAQTSGVVYYQATTVPTYQTTAQIPPK